MRNVALCLLMAVAAKAAQAQIDQIDPTSQIQWNLMSGTGAPAATCTQNGQYATWPYGAQWGQEYQDTSVTPNNVYICGSHGWQLQGGGSGGCGASPCTIAQGGTGASTAPGAQYNLTLGGVGEFPVPGLINDGSTENLSALNAVTSPTSNYLGHILLPTNAQGQLGTIRFGYAVGGYSTPWLIAQSGTSVHGGGFGWMNTNTPVLTTLDYRGSGLGSSGPDTQGRVVAGPVPAIEVSCDTAPTAICSDVSMSNFNLVGPNNSVGDGISLVYNTQKYTGDKFLLDKVSIKGFNRAFAGFTWANYDIGNLQVAGSSSATATDWSVVIGGLTPNSSIIHKLQYGFFGNCTTALNPSGGVLWISSGKGGDYYVGDATCPNNVVHIGNYYAQPNGGSAVSITATLTGTALTSLTLSGGTGYVQDLTLAFAGCATTPTAVMQVTGGVPSGYTITSPGNCASTPTVTVPDPTMTANATVRLGDIERASGYHVYVDASSAAHIYWNGDQGALYTLAPPIQAYAGSGGPAQIDLHGISAWMENPAVGPTASINATSGGGLAIGTWYVWYLAFGTSNGYQLNTSYSPAATCVVSVNNSTCLVTPPPFGYTTSCSIYLNSTNTPATAYYVETTACGAGVTVTGLEGSTTPNPLTGSINPVVGNIPLVQVMGTPGGGVNNISVYCVPGRIDGIYGSYAQMILLGNGTYINACGTTSWDITTGTLPTASVYTVGARIQVMPTSGVSGTLACYTGTITYTGSTPSYGWSPDQCNLPATMTNSTLGIGRPDNTTITQTGGVLTVIPGQTGNNAPLWLQNLESGADGVCDIGAGKAGCTTLIANSNTNSAAGWGDGYYTTFTVEAGATLTISNCAGLTVHATGAIVINGTIVSGNNSCTPYAAGGGSGASGGAGAGNSAAAGSIYTLPGAAGTIAANGGGASTGGSGNNGTQPNLSVYRALLNSGVMDGLYWSGANGSQGGSSGGAAGDGGAPVTLIGASISGTGSISTSGNPGVAGGSNTGGGGGGGGGMLTLSSESLTSFSSLTLTAAGGIGGGAGSGTSFPGGTGAAGQITKISGW